MTRLSDIRGLLSVTSAALAAAESRMAALRRQEADLRARLAELDGARKAREAEATVEDAALRAGADLRWHLWIEQRRASLNMELARTLAAMEQARATLARDFGRNTATEALAEDLTKAARDLAAKRAERGW